MQLSTGKEQIHQAEVRAHIPGQAALGGNNSACPCQGLAETRFLSDQETEYLACRSALESWLALCFVAMRAHSCLITRLQGRGKAGCAASVSLMLVMVQTGGGSSRPAAVQCGSSNVSCPAWSSGQCRNSSTRVPVYLGARD